MGVLYILAGINHFVHPRFYREIMPPWVPHHSLMVWVSGLCEVLFAMLLLNAATSKAGAWLIIVLLIAIFPANIQMAVNFMKEGNPWLWVAIVRLPVQVALIWWAWLYTK